MTTPFGPLSGKVQLGNLQVRFGDQPEERRATLETMTTEQVERLLDELEEQIRLVRREVRRRKPK